MCTQINLRTFIYSVSKLSVSHAAKPDGDTTQPTTDTTQPVANGDLNKTQEIQTPDELPNELTKGLFYYLKS